MLRLVFNPLRPASAVKTGPEAGESNKISLKVVKLIFVRLPVDDLSTASFFFFIKFSLLKDVLFVILQ